MAKPHNLTELLKQISVAEQRTISFVWLDRAVRTHASVLLVMAEDEQGALRLGELPPIADLEQAINALAAMAAVVDAAASRWRNAVAEARQHRSRWPAVLERLGPQRVTIWSAFIDLGDELKGLLESAEDGPSPAAAGGFARYCAATVAGIQAGGAPASATRIADAVGGEERSRQENEILALLPV